VRPGARQCAAAHITGHSSAGNNTIARSDKVFTAEVSNSGDPSHILSIAVPLTELSYSGSLLATTAGMSSMALIYEGSYLPGFPVALGVNPGPIAAAQSVLRALPPVVVAGEIFSVVLEGRDAFGNLVLPLVYSDALPIGTPLTGKLCIEHFVLSADASNKCGTSRTRGNCSTGILPEIPLTCQVRLQVQHGLVVSRSSQDWNELFLCSLMYLLHASKLIYAILQS
jgi:hypothetical protein